MKQDGITRGPWTIEGPDQFGDFNIHHPADRLAIGAVVSNLRPSEEVAANAHFIVAACNAYEPMREALILAEKADRIHSKCQECEDGAQAPEACGDCFPSADDARVARRNVLKYLGVRMRDVDRARAIKAEPSICNCSQEDVHDYGPCGEDCRSLVVSTLPVNDRQTSDDVGRLREALAKLSDALEEERRTYEHYRRLFDAGRPIPANAVVDRKADAFDAAYAATNKAVAHARAALKGVPQPASNDYQADASAPALSEKFNARLEWRPIESAPADGTEILAYMPGFALGQMVLYWQDGYWREKANSLGLKYPPTHWMPLPSPPGAELNISNEAERDAVSLKSDTSSQPASEAGKLSTDEVL